MKVNGFIIRLSSGCGKAGKGRDRTSTIQVTEPCGEGYMIKKSFRYIPGDRMSYDRARQRAIIFAKKSSKTEFNLNK